MNDLPKPTEIKFAPLAILMSGLIAHAYVLQLHFSRMLSTEHYSFFPFGLLGAVVLWRQNAGQIESNATKPRTPIVSGLMLLSLGAVLTASLLESTFIGWWSFLLFLVAFVYACFGAGGLRGAYPFFLMLIALTPLPILLDRKLIQSMQQLASWMASVGLDAFGVVHVRLGVVLVSATKSFLAEEACSGVRSLFSSIAGIVFWGLLHRYSIWHHILNLIQTVFWVLLYNGFRIFLVVFVEDSTNFSIASGWKHDAIGFFVFFFIALTALSTDRLIQALFPSKSSEAEQEDEPGREVSTTRGAKLSLPSISVIPVWLQRTTIACFVLVGLFCLRLYGVGSQSVFVQKLPDMAKSDLEEQIGDWKVTNFEKVTRSGVDLQESIPTFGLSQRVISRFAFR